MRYGSGVHILSVLVALLCLGGTWAILRRCSVKRQQLAVLGIMLLNAAQHFLKPFLYPQYAGTGFSHVETAYNVCAFLIIISPVVYLRGNRLFRNFLWVIGTVAGIGTIAFPVWYIGRDLSVLWRDYVRFYICHSLLLCSSALPLLLGHHKPSYKEFWQVGLGFLLALVFVLANNVAFISAGLYSGTHSRDIYAGLWKDNPCLMMGPPEALSWLADISRMFTPAIFLGENPAGICVPILWYAIPLYLGISLGSFLLFAAMDRKNFAAALRKKKQSFRGR